MRVAIVFEVKRFLRTLTLMVMSSLRVLYGLTCCGAKPPPVAVVEIAEDDELQVASRHPTPSWGAFRFIDHPTHSPAGSKHALTLRAVYSANLAEVTFRELRLDGVQGRSQPDLTQSLQGVVHLGDAPSRFVMLVCLL